MDLYDSLVTNCSPYIFALIYDIDERVLIIECVADPKKPEPVKRIVFPDIIQYQETNLLDAPDDENLDDIVDITKTKTGIIVTTFKKEITLTSSGEAFSEEID